MKHRIWILGAVALVVLLAASGCSSDKGTTAPVIPPNTEDTAPPLAPAGLNTPKVDGHGFLLVWEPNTEPDLQGYRVYVYQPSPDRESAYVLWNPDALISRARFVCDAGTSEGDLWVRVTALDASGNESAFSPAFRVSPVQVAPSADGSMAGSDEPDRPGRPGRPSPIPPVDLTPRNE